MPSAGEHFKTSNSVWSAMGASLARASSSQCIFGGNAMKLSHRRQFLHLAVGAAVLPSVSRIARAQAYPSRPVRILVGYAAGGPLDTSGRLMAQWLSERLGQQFVIENRPGAGSNIATEAVARARPDGYTLLQASASNAWNAALYDNLNFDFIRDFAQIATVRRAGGILEVNPSIPARTVPEFIAYAKANPGVINFASTGIGSGTHVVGELFKIMTGVNLVHVPYRGEAPALTDLIGGQVQVFFSTLPGSIEFIRAGKLRPLAVTTAKRQGVLPDIPPLSDFLTGYEASGWSGLGAPKATPAEIVEKLNKEINAALADPKIKARLADLGGTPLVGSPADFGKLIADDTEKWGKVIRAANIKPE